MNKTNVVMLIVGLGWAIAYFITHSDLALLISQAWLIGSCFMENKY